MQERVVLTTSDGKEIVGIYRPGDGEKFAILLHMMPATKESWEPFADILSEMGYGSLAIDARGHGESTMNGLLNYKTFSDKQHQAKIEDVEVALSFLKDHGAAEEEVVVVGASIGANLAIQFLQKHPHIMSAIALSPGVDYHGVVSDVSIENLADEQRVLLMASSEDVYSFESIEELHELNRSQTSISRQSGAGHGTMMFLKK